MKEKGFINEKLTPKHEEEEAAATKKKKKEMHEKSHRIEIEHGDFLGYRVNEICFFISLLPLPG